ncbi:hypothetical protein [Microbacterium thalassium]|uniref:Uncharacterized protein n=1 Tax=Microbacterium thalassium TaxID=362649 RepID=A0A7X0FRS9_9MICO|nr:hypothetical protein [Microbacterium thalassium]MBB6391975.1 hypothetical protein [Microbacterium thalassium]GLK23995.1 hypothetical protein GCM10017607_13130 [Microbacterium thalassium]
MDAAAWMIAVLAASVVVTLVALAPRMKRDQRRRQLEGSAGGSLAGVGAGFDAVWQPTAEQARADWESRLELPAPAPTPDGDGRVEDGRLTIVLRDDT